MTGLLVRTNDEYLQILEGGKDEINSVLQKVFYDSRHTNLEIICFSQSEIKYFQNWSMAGLDIHLTNKKFYEFLLGKYSLNDKRLILPSDESIALSFLLDVKYNIEVNQVA